MIKMLPIKRKSSSKRKSKKQITSLLRQDPFNDQIDYTDLDTIASLAEIDSENALIQIESAKSFVPFKFAQAKKYFDKAVALEPENASFYFEFAETLRRANMYSREFYNKAYRMDPNNADHVMGYLRGLHDQMWRWKPEMKAQRERLINDALSVDSSHPQANYHAAKLWVYSNPSYSGLMTYSGAVEKAWPHAKLALKDASSLPKAEEALMHDILACFYAKEKRFRSAFQHFDKALECEPFQGNRNYWKFLKKSKFKPELLEIVQGSLAKNFELREGRDVEDLFRMYATLTPGFRALLKKNSRSTYLFLQEFAIRERKWMLTLYPFNSDFFPKTVTMEILDFLFYL